MELKQFVLLEDGRVLDFTKTHIDQFYNGINYPESTKIDRVKIIDGVLGIAWRTDRSKPLWTTWGKVAATADDILDFVNGWDGWIGLFDDDKIPKSIRFTYKDRDEHLSLPGVDLVHCGDDQDYLLRRLHTLYAPITEKGKVVRYELVWEKDPQ